jgi:class 3 adenylate cyclase
VAWFRLQVIIDSGLAGKPLAITMTKSAKADVFIDGRPISSSAEAPQSMAEDSVIPVKRPMLFTLEKPGTHLIAVRLENTGAVPGGGSPGSQSFFIVVNTAKDALRAHSMQSTTITSVLVLFFTFFVAFALIHLILFLYYRARRSNLYFALFCLGLGALFFAAYCQISLHKQGVGDWMQRYGALIVAGVAASLSALVNDLFGFGRMRFRIAQATLVVGAVAPFVDVIGDYVQPLLFVAVMIEAVVLIVRGMIRRVAGARIIGAGVLFFALVVLWICFLVTQGPEFSLSMNESAGAVFAASVVIAIISIPLSMSVYLAWSFADVNKKLSRQLSEVERLSAEALEHEAEKQRLLEIRADELELEVAGRTEELRGQKEKSDELLRNILPAEVAEELKEKGSAAARYYEDASVLFTDFADFTQMAEKLSPDGLVDELNHCFSAFDAIITRHGLEKIKTVGDAYIAVSGLPAANPRHAHDVVVAALEIRAFMIARKAAQPGSFTVRLGVHSGPLVAGIVGVKKFAYDIWGDTVNTAARMEQHSEPGRVNISAATYELVKDEFLFSYRGELEAKHKGKMGMYFVEGQIANSPIRQFANEAVGDGERFS